MRLFANRIHVFTLIVGIEYVRQPAIPIGQWRNTHVLRCSQLSIRHTARQNFRIAVYTFNINRLARIFLRFGGIVTIPLIVHLQIDIFSRSVVIRRTCIAEVVVLRCILPGHPRTHGVIITIARHAHSKTLDEGEIRPR